MARIEETKSSSSLGRSSPIYTAGEFFADGSAIELLANGSGADNRLALLYWRHSRASVRSHFDIAGTRYFPIRLHASIRSAMRLPRAVAREVNPTVLFSKLTKVFQSYVSFDAVQGELLTAWVVSTWFPEFWSHAPDLAITGWDVDCAMLLLRLLGCVTRHPLLLTGVERTSFRSLPMECYPTMLINQPSMSARTLDFLRSSNYGDVVVPGTRGAVYRAAGSRAIFLGIHALDSDGLRVALPPAASGQELLSNAACERVADEFQPQLLRYRLVHLTRFCGNRTSNEIAGLAREAAPVGECIYGAADFKYRVAAIALTRNEEIRAERMRKPEVAAVEVLWGPLHSSREQKLTAITRLVNALIRSRGETLEYSEVEIGLMLRNLGLPRHRNGAGMVLRFSAENRKRLHDLAHDFGLALKKNPDCAACQSA